MEVNMDPEDIPENPNPRESANIFNRLVLWWFRSLLWRAKSEDFKSREIYHIITNSECEKLCNTLEEEWNKELEASARTTGRTPRLWRAIFKSFTWFFFQDILYMVVLEIGLRPLQPVMLGLLLESLGKGRQSLAYTTAYCLVFLSLILVANIAVHHLRFNQLENGIRVRIACSSLIFKKILRLPCTSCHKSMKTQIRKELTKIKIFDRFFMFLHYSWITPAQVMLFIYLMVSNVGVAAIGGFVAIVIQGVPLQAYCNLKTAILCTKVSSWTSERTSLVSAVLDNIHATKIYCWERAIEKLIYLTRRYEIDVLIVAGYVRGVNLASRLFSQHTSLFITIFIYINMGYTLSASNIFPLILYFFILQDSIPSLYPKAVVNIGITNRMVRSVEKFLFQDEVDPGQSIAPLNEDNLSVRVTNVTATWARSSNIDVLQNIDISLYSETLYIVLGPAGAGKSSFLKLILGELGPKVGSVAVRGSISYASRTPWVFRGTIRSNILCNEVYDEQKYGEILQLCQLTGICQAMDSGDETVVDSKKLTSEERAKINLARALYRTADIYLLDDAFALLSDEIFDACVNRLLREKTRIVSMMNQNLRKVYDDARIIYFNHGRIEFVGSTGNFETTDKYIHPSNRDSKVSESHDDTDTSNLTNLSDTLSLYGDKDEEESVEESNELLSRRTITKHVYWKYLRAGGSPLRFFLFIMFAILTQLSIMSSDFWLANWTSQMARSYQNNSHANNSSTGSASINGSVGHEIGSGEFFFFHPQMSLGIYGIMILGTIIMPITKNAIFFKICMAANERLYDQVVARLIRAPMQFFYVYPTTTIMKQFTKDINTLDKVLPKAMLVSSQVILDVVSATILLTIVNFWTIIPIMLVTAFYLNLIGQYFKTFRRLKGLNETAYKQVQRHAVSWVKGLPTIRSLQGQQLMLDVIREEGDVQSLIFGTTTAFGLWLDGMSTALEVMVLLLILLTGMGGGGPAYVGLAVGLIARLTGIARVGVKTFEKLVHQRPSLERVIEYSTEMEHENPFENDVGRKRSRSWPTKGEIKFEHVSARFLNHDEPFLLDVNFTIEGGSKVTIVETPYRQRTTLVNALFRIANIEGILSIDGVNVRTIGVQTLRDRISFISQDETFFSNTARDNLDPMHEYTDAELWSVLETVKLNNIFVSLEQSASHLSTGRRKLLSLARAILKKNVIHVIDDTIDNVDPATDEIFREIIETEFKDCTVITMTRASRALSNLDCDRIIILTNGVKTSEFDCRDGLPHEELFSSLYTRSTSEASTSCA